MAGAIASVTTLAASITQLFDEAGASQVERYAALEVAKALVPVSGSPATWTAPLPVSVTSPESDEA